MNTKSPGAAHKSPRLYRYILIAWLALVLLALPALYALGAQSADRSVLAGWLVFACSAFIMYFWLNGTKDIVYTLYYHRNKAALMAGPPVRILERLPRVVLVYCTYNDFDGDSLEASMDQNYGNFETVILDDSTDPEIMATIDAFGRRTGARVQRRHGHRGFKAGNLNNYLRHAKYDYFVILDSDEIIPSNFVRRALDYFRPGVGIVQANHIATRNRNPFMQRFAAGVDSHWPAYQSVKQRHGFLSLLGHGAMVSRVAYVTAHGFPEVVAEDLCFSIRARGAGFVTVFAPDIVCEEEYPVNYLAFKKRHSKWTQGNMEFIKRFTGEIIRSDMHWFEKLDIVLFTYSLPLTAFFFCYLVINILALPLLHYSLNYPLWLILPTLLFLAAPMLNDVLTYAGKKRKRDILGYSLSSFLLYGSMFFASLRASTTSLVGKSVFIVTPKSSTEITRREALAANLPDMAFVTSLGAATIVFDHSLLPCILLIITGLSGPYLTRLSNIRPVPVPAADRRESLIAAGDTIKA